MKHSTRIALIHATPVAVDPVGDAFRTIWPECHAFNILEDSLALDLKAAGTLDDAMMTRFRALARYAVDTGANGILFTCSAFGTAIEAAAADVAPIPVLKPNEAMFAEALASGQRPVMLSTFGPSIPSMQREYALMAAAAGYDPELECVLVDHAMQDLLNGDAESHDARILDACDALQDTDTVMLAQFSMARAAGAVAKRTGATVLTSPASAVRAMQAAVEENPKQRIA